MNTFHLISLGCPKNFVDSEVMIGVLEGTGWELVESPEDAYVLMVNTCGFIQSAVEESVDEILELATIKREYPEKLIVVTGCMVQRYREKLERELPEVDLFVGTEGVRDINTIIGEFVSGKSSLKTQLPSRFIMNSDTPRTLATPFFRAWLKTTEGCNNHCAYCMIPSIRGPLRSRPPADLVAESALLEERGVKELTLIAQDLTAYGQDLDTTDNLLALLRTLIASSSFPWIRLLYLYPTGITDELLELVASEPRILPYLDIPFQHISDTVLRKMNRRYTAGDLFKLIVNSRKTIPDLALRTTFLLGFPGETEKDILQLEDFLRSMKIDHVGVFAYANEEGCPSEHFSGQISEEEKKARLSYILSVQAEVSEEIQKKYLGNREEVLVEGLSRETDLLLEGRTKYQAPDIDGCVYINEGNANPGDIVQVRISETQVYDLVGGIVD